MSRNNKETMLSRMLGIVVCALLFFTVFILVDKFINIQFEVFNPYEDTSMQQTDKDAEEAAEYTGTANIPAKQLIYVYNEETKDIEQIYLAILRCDTVWLSFLRIPVDTQITLSNSLYQEISRVDSKLPQVMTLSRLYTYFNDDTAYEYGELMLEEAFQTTIDYYTAYPDTLFSVIMQEEPESVQYGGFLQEDLLKTIQDYGGMKDFLTYLYEGSTCSISLSDRMVYLETYEGLTNKRLSYDVIPGTQYNNGYELEYGRIKGLLEQMTGY